jgi:hypothetical protein
VIHLVGLAKQINQTAPVFWLSNPSLPLQVMVGQINIWLFFSLLAEVRVSQHENSKAKRQKDPPKSQKIPPSFADRR